MLQQEHPPSPGGTGWLLLSHPGVHLPHRQREHPAGLSSTPVGASCPALPLPAPTPAAGVAPRAVRRLSLGKRPANGSQGPPDIPPSVPLKEKCPSELPSTLMHGAGGVLLKAKASRRLSSPLERPKRCSGMILISAVGVGVYPKMLEGGVMSPVVSSCWDLGYRGCRDWWGHARPFLAMEEPGMLQAWRGSGGV